MRRGDLDDLFAFLVVAEEHSFTRAAAKMRTSQSALSQTIRRLEERMGVRLLARTTRNVAPTHAGTKLLETLRPALDAIQSRMDAIVALGQRPAGHLRLTASQHAADTVLGPAIARFLNDYQNIELEVLVEDKMIDIVSSRFDGGIRLGEHVQRDMIAVRVGPDLRMAVVGSPAYFSKSPKPRTPYDLTAHPCINFRLPTLGDLYAWEFEKDGRIATIRVNGFLVCNSQSLILRAAMDGLGLAFLMEDALAPYIADGRLIRVLDDWCPSFPGYHLYYPSRRQLPPAFALLIDALRYHS